MIKRFILGIGLGIGLTLGGMGIVRATEPHSLNYVVINRVNLDGTVNCSLTLERSIADALRTYYAPQTIRDDLCVTKVDLTQAGIDNLPEQLGDRLVGIYAATDGNGNPKPFSVYLPLIHN